MPKKPSEYTTKRSICFVAHHAYGALASANDGQIGGVEHQTTMMARWFANQGYQVSFITWDEGQPQDQIIDGIRVIKTCCESEGIPGLRFFHPRWTSLLRALQRADADIYYQNCAEYVTGQVALWCQKHQKQFVYSVASDPDCNPSFPTMPKLRERLLYKYGLLNADRVIVQTHLQQNMLKNGFNLSSIVLPMPCEGPDDQEFEAIKKVKNNTTPRILWVGRLAPVKRAELLLDVAQALPNVDFDLVGAGNQEAEYPKAILAKAKGLTNVKMHGTVQRDKIGKVYETADIMCCTSSYEGFPNTFLEAWSYGIPIVSTVDPDHLISERNFGLFAKDLESLVASVSQLIENHVQRNKMSLECREYFQNRHTIDKTMKQFEKVLISDK